MGTLISLVILIIIGALILYLVRMLPLDAKLMQIIQVIVIVIFILYLLGMLGGYAPAIRLG